MTTIGPWAMFGGLVVVAWVSDRRAARRRRADEIRERARMPGRRELARWDS